ncbi:MAG: glutathione S-transferase family protein [Pseudomonadota bacterium]
MKLHESPSPNARRVHVFMAEKGIEIERVAVDIRAGENIGEAYLAKNPGGRVPMLELDDGTYLSESVAICRYLEGLHPEPNLFGSNPLESATIEMWTRRVELLLMSDVAGAFRNITGFFKDRETCVKEWGEVCAERVPKTVAMFDAQLANTQYLAGDRFTNADLTLGVVYDFAKMVKVVEIPSLPNLERWYGEVSTRPSFSAS